MVDLKLKALVAVAVAGILAGCAVGPDYREPDLSLPKTFVAASSEVPSDPRAAQLAEFWTVFGDATLDDLM
jgi:outer membrane protein TolC